MLIAIFNKILIMVLIMSVLNIIRHIYFVIQLYVRNDEEREKYSLNGVSLILLGLSIAYLITSIVTGIYI